MVLIAIGRENLLLGELSAVKNNIMDKWLREAIIRSFGFMPNIYKYKGRFYFELFGYLADVDAYTIYELGDEQILGLFEMETYCSQNISISSYLSKSDYREIEQF